MGCDAYRIRTRITEEGSTVEAGQQIVKREKKTRREMIEELDKELEYESRQLNRSVTSIDQIRTFIRTFRDRICTEIFPGRNNVPKTLIFAKDDNHAEEIIKRFRNSVMPRVVMSVDMISTGTDIKPLERKSSVSFEKLLRGVALGAARDEDSLQSLADRLARMDRGLERAERDEIESQLQTSAEVRGHDVRSIQTLTNKLLDATDLDTQIERAKAAFGTDDPTGEQIEAAAQELAQEAVAPIIDPDVRETIKDVRQRSYIAIDEISADEVIEIEQTSTQDDWAEQAVRSFEAYIDEHKDEITALRIFYEQPYGQRHLTLEQAQELAGPIQQPPLELTPAQLEWLELIKDHLVANLTVEMEDFEYAPFDERGGIYQALDLFDRDELDALLDELNDVVTA